MRQLSPVPWAGILTCFNGLSTCSASNCSLLTAQGYSLLAGMQTGGVYFSYLVTSASNALQPAGL